MKWLTSLRQFQQLKISILSLSTLSLSYAHAADQPSVDGFVFGLTKAGVAYHLDGGQSGNFVYLCLNDACYTAELKGDRYQFDFSSLINNGASEYQLSFKIQDNVTGQCLVESTPIALGSGVNESPCYAGIGNGTPSDSGDNGNDDNANNGGEPDNNNTDFDHLDWTSNSLTNGLIGPAPRPDPPEAIASPLPGYKPSTYGFAFDIANGQVNWRWGPSINKGPGDSGLEMHCSQDGNATFNKVAIVNGQAKIPCSGTYTYFFRYLHGSHALNNNPATRWIWTALFTTEKWVDANNYPTFTDGSANWMRFRHPVTQDGTTAAILDAQHNNDRLRNLGRYVIWVNDKPGNLDMRIGLDGVMNRSVIRNEAHRNFAGGPNGQQFFSVVTGGEMGFGDAFSYGQTVSFEFTAVAGKTGAQTYNDFSHYVVGCGWCGKYGDPRLNPAGKASTSQVFSDSGAYIQLEKNARFTQPLVTIHKEDMIDDFIVGHHLFHGVDPNKVRSSLFDDPDVQIGARTCGSCHFRDGRGDEVVNIPGKGPRLTPPIYGLKLLEMIEGRKAGFTWDGKTASIADQVHAALRDDHKVDPKAVPARARELITSYVEALTVPARDPGTYDKPGVSEGDILFNQIGCASCHTPVQRTRSDAPTHLRNITLRPYTDMKRWDLGDRDGKFRTTPLWGLGHNIEILERNGRKVLYWHDGSAPDIKTAIQKHNGDAAKVKAAFNALSQQEQENIINFIKTL